jgi:hypothetical protein
MRLSTVRRGAASARWPAAASLMRVAAAAALLHAAAASRCDSDLDCGMLHCVFNDCR